MKLDTHLAVSAISCMEVSLLEKRGRIQLPFSVKDWLKEALENSGVESLPVTCEIMHKLSHFPIFRPFIQFVEQTPKNLTKTPSTLNQ